MHQNWQKGLAALCAGSLFEPQPAFACISIGQVVAVSSTAPNLTTLSPAIARKERGSR